jgi:hypothetical protein
VGRKRENLLTPYFSPTPNFPQFSHDLKFLLFNQLQFYDPLPSSPLSILYFRLHTNLDAVIVINLDDAINATDVNLVGNMTDIINSWLGQYFGSAIYTPIDLVRNLSTLPLSPSSTPEY